MPAYLVKGRSKCRVAVRVALSYEHSHPPPRRGRLVLAVPGGPQSHGVLITEDTETNANM